METRLPPGPSERTVLTSNKLRLGLLAILLTMLVWPAMADDTAELLRLVNLERHAVGVGPVLLSTPLMQAARGHAEDMAIHDRLSHTGSNGSSFTQRIAAEGYQASRLAENVAAGYRTPAAVMALWMGSAGHRANILNPAFKALGIGKAYNAEGHHKFYWVQDFGSSTDEVPLPPSPPAKLDSFQLFPNKVVGGKATIGQVELTNPAPYGGITVRLASSNPALATLPARVTIGRGNTKALFLIRTSKVTATSFVILSAQHGKHSRPKTLWLTVE